MILKKCITKVIPVLLLFSISIMCVSTEGVTSSEIGLSKESKTISAENSKREHELLNTSFEVSDIPEELLESLDIDVTKIKDIDDVDSLDLNSITTINKDDSRTLHVFDAPIKYYDIENSKIEFIDNTLKKSDKKALKNGTYAYENAANNIKVFIPQANNDSIIIENGAGNSLEFKPISDVVSKAKISKFKFISEEQNVVEYKGVFGNGYDLHYIPQNDGVKENIFITKNSGKYTFDFTLKAQGLIPNCTTGETINFVNDKTEDVVRDSENAEDNNNVVFTLGELFIRDSYTGKPDGKEHLSFDNYYKIEDLGDYNYKVIYVLDRDFLNKESTVYPILVDPSISPITSINDAPVYSKKPTVNFASNQWIELGYVDSAYGVGNGFFQTATMQNYTYINPNKITKATLRLYEGSGTTYSSKINAYDTDDTWKSTSINWNNQPGKYGSALSSVTISSSGFCEFPITSVVKEWLRDKLWEGGWPYNYGVMLVPNSTTQGRKDFCSANYGTVSRRPSIKIDYEEDTSITNNTYFISNYNSGLYLDADTSNDNVRQYNITGTAKQEWIVKGVSNGYYTIANRHYGPAGYLDVEDPSVSPPNADIWPGITGDWNKFKIIKNNDGSGTYRIMSKVLDDLKALYIPGGSLNSGANAAFANYTGDFKSQWEFSKANTLRATVNSYYDQAFDIRYSAGGNRAIKLNEVNAVANSHFKNVFGLIIANNTPIMVTSTADNCKLKRGVGITATTIDQKCPGGTNHTPSCTGWTQSYSDFIAKYPGNDIKVSALWTGNKLFGSNGMMENRSFSWYDNGITIQELGSNDSNFYNERISVLTHELSHAFGAPDHYHEINGDGSCTGGALCITCNPKTGRPTYCLMNDGWMSDIKTRSSSSVWCEACKQNIKTHLSEHHY